MDARDRHEAARAARPDLCMNCALAAAGLFGGDHTCSEDADACPCGRAGHPDPAPPRVHPSHVFTTKTTLLGEVTTCDLCTNDPKSPFAQKPCIAPRPVRRSDSVTSEGKRRSCRGCGKFDCKNRKCGDWEEVETERTKYPARALRRSGLGWGDFW